jgi:hypothetical protein
MRDLGEGGADNDVSSVGSRRVHELEPGIGAGRQVLCRVHGDVGRATSEGGPDVVGEGALPADRPQGNVGEAIAERGDDHGLDRHPERLGHERHLPEREAAASGRGSQRSGHDAARIE